MIKLKPRPLTKNEISQEIAIAKLIKFNRGKFNLVTQYVLNGKCNTRITSFTQQTKTGSQIKGKI